MKTKPAIDKTILVNQLWETLKQECTKNPDEAKLIPFLSEEKFKKVVAPVLAAFVADALYPLWHNDNIRDGQTSETRSE